MTPSSHGISLLGKQLIPKEEYDNSDSDEKLIYC